MSHWSSETLARFIRDCAVPELARDAARRHLLDTLAAAAAGRDAAAARAVGAVAETELAGRPCSVWWTGQSTGPVAAAWANSAAASALDIDDGHRAASGHPGAVVVPVALAVAEACDASAETLLDAIAIGYEVGIRIAAARNPEGLDTVSTGRWGAAAAVAAAAALGDAPEATIAAGLAIATSHAPLLHPPGSVGHAVKEGIPWSALTGMLALRLAEHGLSGPTDIFDRPRYFDAERITEELGAEWLVTSAYLKPYACCRWLHAAIDSALTLQRTHGFGHQDVSDVRVATFGRVARLFLDPDPEDLETAQYDVSFCVALALARGPEALLPLAYSSLHQHEVVELARRVHVHIDDELDAAYPAKTPARLSIRTAEATHVLQVDHPLGDPANPMSAQQLHDKFATLTSPRMGAAAEALYDIGTRLGADVELPRLLRLLGPVPENRRVA